jgi:hypothetical protein
MVVCYTFSCSGNCILLFLFCSVHPKGHATNTIKTIITYLLQRLAGSMPSSSELEYQPETNYIHVPLIVVNLNRVDA